MDLDLKIDDNDGNGGNIETTIKNDQCIKCIKNMFAKSTRMIYLCMIHICICSYFIHFFYYKFVVYIIFSVIWCIQCWFRF